MTESSGREQTWLLYKGRFYTNCLLLTQESKPPVLASRYTLLGEGSKQQMRDLAQRISEDQARALGFLGEGPTSSNAPYEASPAA